MIDKSILAFVRVEQPVARNVTCYDVVVVRSSLTKGGKIMLLKQDGMCLSC